MADNVQQLEGSKTSAFVHRKCIKCKRRIPSIDYDPHKICFVCRGYVCSPDKRCEECETWDMATVKKAEKNQYVLKLKRDNRKKVAKIRSSNASLLSGVTNPDSVIRQESNELDSIAPSDSCSNISRNLNIA